jgi:hypothetical protein
MKNRSSFRKNSQIDYWLAKPQAGTWGAIVVGGAGMIMGGIQQNKAAKAAKAAGQSAQVDINALDARARQIAQQNAQDSAALEQQMTPEVVNLRRDSINQVLQTMGPNASDDYAQNQLTSLVQGGNVGPSQTPLLRAAIAKAKADLAMGGRLGADTQNAVTRSSLAQAGGVAGNLGLGRDVVARDLGRTSMDVENQRLQAASQLGGQELALSQSDTNTAFNNRASILNAIQMLQGIKGGQFSRAMGAAQLGQSIQRPVVGLDPGSVVDLTVGNSNAQSAANANRANIAGQTSQNYMQFGGQMLGQGLMAYNSSRAGTNPYIGAYPNTLPQNQHLPGGG